MASSNRHWPSMFKSKPSNHHHNQRPTTHDHTRNPHTPSSVQAAEERPPEPKPRWNPKPEQIRTLESIFNSGTVNPSRDEIRRIRVQLQEYGQVGDANVFYWFQNRKSRIKQKQRQLLQNYRPRLSTNQASATAPAASSSSSSNNSNYENTLCVGSPNSHVIDLLNNNNNNNSSNNSPTEPTILQSPVDFLTEPPSFSLGLKHGNLVNELMLMSDGPSKKDEDVEKMKMKECIIASPSLLGGVGLGESKMSHVFINDVCFEIGMGPVNVRETFGDDAVLLHSSTGQPVLANEWGLTHQPLQHGASYYLLHPHDHAKIV